MSFHSAEWHHGYLGLALVAVSFFWGGVWLLVPGSVLVVDDVAQHFFGVDPSPIHGLYVRYLWPIPVVQRLNRWLDKAVNSLLR